VWQLAAAYAEIALRRRGPESLPDSGFLVLVTLLADFAVNLVDLGFYRSINQLGLLVYMAEVLPLFVLVFGVLAFFRLERRYRQTMAALLGTDMIITLAFLPIAAFGTLTGLDMAAEPFALLRVAFLFWLIYASGTILARSLNQPVIVGLGFEILFICVSLFIVFALAAGSDSLEAVAG